MDIAWQPLPIGRRALDTHGHTLPPETLETLKTLDIESAFPGWKTLKKVLGADGPERDQAQALAHFERLCEEHPELPDPWNNIALLQVRAGRIEAARAALDNALRADPAHRIARANLGLVHLMLAEAAWQRLVDSGPVDPALGHRLEAVRALLAGARP